MALIPSFDEEVFQVSKFIDFDRDKKVFYNNLYIEDCDYVVKIPLSEKRILDNKIKIERFNLAKYTYLLNYE